MLFLVICESIIWLVLDIDQLVDLYKSKLRDIVDDRVPLRTKKMPRRLLLPRYNKRIQAAKSHKRYHEWLCIMTGLCDLYEMFKVSTIQVKNTPASFKSEYYNKKIEACKGNQRTVFSILNKVLYKSQTILPNIINSDTNMSHCLNNIKYT